MLPVKHDPSPSRLRYRAERLWLKKSVRRIVRVYLPICAATWIAVTAFNNDAIRAAAYDTWLGARNSVAARPELKVEMLSMPDASDNLQAQIFAVADIDLPASSLDIDVMQIKLAIEGLDAVKTAEVMILPGGTLEIRTTERVPTMVWRDGETLRLIDDEGKRVAQVARRLARPDLPLVVGDGADRVVPEIHAMIEVLGPVTDRVRGFVRVGERRWDVVLDRGQTIMLPETGGVTALRRVMAFQSTQALLDRDVEIIDMRNGDRPVLRLTENAIDQLRIQRAYVRGEDA